MSRSSSSSSPSNLWRERDGNLEPASQEHSDHRADVSSLSFEPHYGGAGRGGGGGGGVQLPHPFDYPDAPAASGLALDAYGRGTVFMASMFLGPALLQLANTAAGCELNDDESICDNKVYGFRPSSLLSNIAIAAGLCSSVALPLCGAVVDHTPHRRRLGVVTAMVLSMVKGVEVMVGTRTWFIVALLQVGSSLLYGLHSTVTYAYTSELAVHDADRQTKYNTDFFVLIYVATLVFMIAVITISYVSNVDDVGTARISQTLSSTISACFFYVAWCWRGGQLFFADRPARHEVPARQTLWTCGFWKLWGTAQKIARQDEYAGLKHVICTIMFAEAATSALVTVATTYMTQVLRMNSNEIGVVFLVVLLTGIPGSKLGEAVSLRLHNPVASAMLCDVFFIVSTTWAALSLDGPQDKHRVFFFAALWGLGLGWLPPIHTTAYISLLPPGAEAELMGTYLFAGQVLGWLPPLVFTVLNERGWPMSLGLASLNIFFVTGLLGLWTLGDYHRALHRVRSLQPLTGDRGEALEHDMAVRNQVAAERYESLVSAMELI